MITMRVMGVLVSALGTRTAPILPVPGDDVAHLPPKGAPHGRRLPGDGPLRRLRVEHGSRTEAPALPLLPAHRHRLDQGLAADLRGRGVRLGGGPCHPPAPRHHTGGAAPPRCPTPPL